MSRPGRVMPKQQIPCTRCGAITLRAAHFVDAKCAACRLKRDRAAEYALNKRTREQAKRYRILITASGYSYEQLLESVSFRRRKSA